MLSKSSKFFDMSASFASQVDSIDVSDAHIALGLSNLEGNIWDGGIKLLSVADGAELHSKHCESGISMVRFAGQSKNFILAARDDGNVALYAASTLEDLLLFPTHDDYVSSVASHPARETEFISSGWDGAIKIWDWQMKNKDVPILSIDNAHNVHVNEVGINSFQPSLLASVGMDGFLRIWDKRNDISRQGCVHLFNLHQASACVMWDACNENVLYCGDDAGVITAFDVRFNQSSVDAGFSEVASHTMSRCAAHKGRVRRLRCLPNLPGVLVSVSDDTTIAVHQLSHVFDDQKLFDEKQRYAVHKDYVADVAVVASKSTEHGFTILSASSDKTMKISKYPPL